MSAADQRKVVAVLRQAPPEGWDRWTPALVATAAGLGKAEAAAAIQSLRYGGKIKFGALELSASMMEEYRAKAGDEVGEGRASESPVEPVSRGADARSSAATSERMDATAGETAPVSGLATQVATERLDDLGSVQDGLHKCPRTGRAGVPLVRATVTSPDTGVTAGETAPFHESEPSPCAHPGERQDDGAAAGQADPLPVLPGQSLPAVSALRPTADVAGAVTLNTAPVASGAPSSRYFFADRPALADDDGSEPVSQSNQLADEIRAEALETGRRRRMARRDGGVRNPLSPDVVAVQRALLAEPEDGFAFLRRKWPGLLGDTIKLARADEVTPATMIVRVMEAGIRSVVNDMQITAAGGRVGR